MESRLRSLPDRSGEEAKFDSLTEFAERKFKRSRDPIENADRWLLSTDFDQRDEGSIQLAAPGKVFLGQLKFLATRLHLDPEGVYQRLISAWSHCAVVFDLCTLKTRVYRQPIALCLQPSRSWLGVELGGRKMSDGNLRLAGSGEGARPLCHAYLVLHFERVSACWRQDDGARHASILWAFGVLADGQGEVAGVWPEIALEAILSELKWRGVRRVRYLCSEPFAASRGLLIHEYPEAEVVSRTKSMTPFARRRVTLSKQTGQQLTAFLRRAIRRKGCFADQDAVVSFALHALNRADCLRAQLNQSASRDAVRRTTDTSALPLRGFETSPLSA